MACWAHKAANKATAVATPLGWKRNMFNGLEMGKTSISARPRPAERQQSTRRMQDHERAHAMKDQTHASTIE
jgi:hypothetical protein